MTKELTLTLIGWRAGQKKDGKKYNCIHCIAQGGPLSSQRGEGDSVMTIWNLDEDLFVKIIEVGIDNSFAVEGVEVNFRFYITRML